MKRLYLAAAVKTIEFAAGQRLITARIEERSEDGGLRIEDGLQGKLESRR